MKKINRQVIIEERVPDTYDCDECGKMYKEVVQFYEKYPKNDVLIVLCKDCLKKALEMLDE